MLAASQQVFKFCHAFYITLLQQSWYSVFRKMLSLQTLGFIFQSVGCSPLLFILMLTCPVFAQWRRPFSLAPASSLVRYPYRSFALHSPGQALLVHPSTGTHHFSKELWFLWVENSIQKPKSRHFCHCFQAPSMARAGNYMSVLYVYMDMCISGFLQPSVFIQNHTDCSKSIRHHRIHDLFQHSMVLYL